MSPDPTIPVREFASFRDPSGYVFRHRGAVYRAVHPSYGPRFRHACQSGLFDKAVASGLLIPFEECGCSVRELGVDEGTCLSVLKPRRLETIAFPYEWCFSQMQDAAVVTLEAHVLALEHGMVLKDATAFNVQFVDGRPALIDHLSFDDLKQHRAWPAYGQFCRHFLAPLLLMSYVDLSLGRLLQLHIDGIPLHLAASLLPWRSRLNISMQIHIHAHARMERKYADTRQDGPQKERASRTEVSPAGHRAIAGSLLSLVKKLKPKSQVTEWGDYYAQTNYAPDAFEAKKGIVRELVAQTRPRSVWDVGGNNGEFSRAIGDLADSIVCMDVDPVAVDQNYRLCKQQGIANILPLVVDLTNPTPGLGFANRERPALFERAQPDLILALALIHHLCIGSNLPFSYVARLFARLAPMLVIEFVPKSDSQVQRLLAGRKDIFPDYDEEAFAAEFSTCLTILAKRPIPGTQRTLYLMGRQERTAA
jgi:hypothetical protein